jgi:hypothetical protein
MKNSTNSRRPKVITNKVRVCGLSNVGVVKEAFLLFNVRKSAKRYCMADKNFLTSLTYSHTPAVPSHYRIRIARGDLGVCHIGFNPFF